MLSVAKRRAARAHRAGQTAERAVDQAAQAAGWQQIAANYRARGGELDRVYIGNGYLIVVEVRYRSRNDYGRAVETVTTTKQARIIRATRQLLATNADYTTYPVRFDVVGVDAAGQLEWIENAFDAV
ncbi:YraN family protein [Salinisphaera sp. USBA-960]|nr:YraN family protein [Salifodinibacter halophilus]NNC26770.1 YraN family protein [Salifodinibacter halophilus]